MLRLIKKLFTTRLNQLPFRENNKIRIGVSRQQKITCSDTAKPKSKIEITYQECKCVDGAMCLSNNSCKV